MATSWSRVRVESDVPGQTGTGKFDVRIYYVDLGLHDTINVIIDPTTEAHQFVNYELAEMPLKFMMCPAFNYVVRLNRVSNFLSLINIIYEQLCAIDYLIK